MRVYLGAFPAAQVARSLRNRPPHQRVSTAQARMTRNNVVCMQPDAAAHNSWLRSSRECGISALNEPDPAPRLGVPVPFGSTQPSHGCVRDTDQLVELPLIGITDAAAQKIRSSIHTIALYRAHLSERLHACNIWPIAARRRGHMDLQTAS